MPAVMGLVHVALSYLGDWVEIRGARGRTWESVGDRGRSWAMGLVHVALSCLGDLMGDRVGDQGGRT